MSTLLITDAGLNYKDAVFGGSQEQNITKFIFANVPGLLETDPISEAAIVPTEHVVHEQPVNRVSSLDDNAVVISCALGHEIGDFAFNWYGAIAKLADNSEILIAVVHTNAQSKTKTQGAVTGNYSVKSIVWRSSAIASSLNVTLATLPWQVDANAFVTRSDFDSHNHDNAYANKTTFENHSHTANAVGAYSKAESDANSNVIEVDETMTAVTIGDRLHVFIDTVDLQIPTNSGTCFDFMVDESVTLTDVNQCRLLAPPGKKIIMNKTPYDSIDIQVLNIRHTARKNSNGDYKI